MKKQRSKKSKVKVQVTKKGSSPKAAEVKTRVVSSKDLDTANLTAEHYVESKEMEPHPDYEHVFVTTDAHGEELLTDQDGNPCKLDEAGDPIYNDEGYPKVTKKRSSSKAKGSGSRKLRVVSNNLLKDRLPLPGFMSYQRVMDSAGNWSRLMSWGPVGVTEDRKNNKKELQSHLSKIKGKLDNLSTDKGRIAKFIRDHISFEQHTRPLEELAYTFFLTRTQDGWLPTVGFASIHQGLPLKNALKALEGK